MKQVEEDDYCRKDSLIIFLTNVKCHQFNEYPDLSDLFIDHFDGTLSYLLDKKIHAILVWASVSFLIIDVFFILAFYSQDQRPIFDL
jgi:hypothetical protein